VTLRSAEESAAFHDNFHRGTRNCRLSLVKFDKDSPASLAYFILPIKSTKVDELTATIICAGRTLLQTCVPLIHLEVGNNTSVFPTVSINVMCAVNI